MSDFIQLKKRVLVQAFIAILISICSVGCFKLSQNKSVAQIEFTLKQEAAIVVAQNNGSKAKYAIAWDVAIGNCLSRHYGIDEKLGDIRAGTRLVLERLVVIRGCSIFFGRCDAYSIPLVRAIGSDQLLDGSDLYCNGRLIMNLVDSKDGRVRDHLEHE